VIDPPPGLRLQPQETPFDDPTSHFRFRKPFVSTSAALETFSLPLLLACYRFLHLLADEHHGLDYLQVFVDVDDPDRKLWFIEDAQVVTALLPSDY